MSAFENFIQIELPKRPYTDTDTNQESVLVRRGAGPRQHVGVELTEGQVLGLLGGVLQGVSNSSLRKYTLTVSVASTIWTVTHGLGSEEVIIQAFDQTKAVLLPNSMQIIDANTIQITFNTPQTGVARVIFLD